jgi:hypothetical protein
VWQILGSFRTRSGQYCHRCGCRKPTTLRKTERDNISRVIPGGEGRQGATGQASRLLKSNGLNIIGARSVLG